MNLMEALTGFWKEIVLAVGILVGAAVFAWLLLLFMQRVLQRLIRHTRSGLDDAILDAVRLPLVTVVMLVAVQIALGQLTFLPGINSDITQSIFYVAYLLVVYWFLFRLIDDLMRWYIDEMAAQTETQLDEKVLPFVRRLALILLTLIAGIILLSYFDVDVSAMVTTLGITSLAFALAAQNTLSDTISGLVIITDRPFTLGDRIEIQELDTWGDVQDIGLRSTRILTRDNRLVIVPNSAISKRLVVNHSVPSTVYRVQTHIGIGYGEDIDRARQVMIESVHAQDWVMKDKLVEALFVEYGESALIFRVRCWIETYVETRRVLDKLNSCLYRGLYGAGIELPTPVRTLYHRVDESDREGVVAVLREAR